mgnify:CR=1 FL=1
MSLPIPDLRFEQGFYRLLEGYAAKAPLVRSNAKSSKSQISAAVVAYAVIKDQVIMAFLQGFVWAGILSLVTPVRRFLVLQ